MAQITQDLIFQPTSISGCQLWLDAADSSVFTLSGSNVLQWNDKSGNGRNAVPRDNTKLPTRYLGFNQRFTVESSSDSTFGTPLLVNIASSNVQGPTGMSFFMAFKFISGTVFTQYEFPRIISFEGTNRFDYGESNTVYTPGGYTNTVNSIVNLNINVSANNLDFRFQGNSLLSTTPSLVTTQFTTTIGIFGRGGASTNIPAQGQISEYIIYNQTLSTTQREQIEGYLAWKWGLQGSLPATHPYKTFAPLANPPFPTQIPPMPLAAKSRLPFTPTQLSGCVLWLDGADSSSMALSGNVITTWRDKSGQGNNATAYNSPTLSGSNVTMNGTNQYFTCPNVSYRPCNIFCVATYTGSSEATILRKGYTTGVTNEFSIAALNTTSLRYEVRTSGGGSISIVPTVASANGIQMYEMTYDNTTALAYFNATLVGTGTATGPVFSGTSLLFLGVIPSDGNNPFTAYFPGSFQEFIIYTSIPTTVQRQQIEGYLSWKWGLAAKLPADHPYKNQPLAPFPFTLTPYIGNLKVWLPSMISGLSLWLDGADRSRMFQNSAATTPVTGTGQAVWVWQDKSGSGRNANFGNGNVTLSNAGPYFPNSQGATNLSMIVGSAFGVAAYASSSYGTGFPGLIGGQYAGGNIMYGYLTTAMGSSLSSATVWANGTINGSTTAPNSNNMWSVVSSSPPNLGFLRVGYGDSGPPSTCWQGTISEIIIYSSSLSTSQRQNVEGYLAWKWGLVASLPANHPYKLFPPKP